MFFPVKFQGLLRPNFRRVGLKCSPHTHPNGGATPSLSGGDFASLPSSKDTNKKKKKLLPKTRVVARACAGISNYRTKPHVSLCPQGFRGGPFQQGGFQGNVNIDPEDLFEQLFGAQMGGRQRRPRGPRPGQDLQLRMKLSFLEAVS